ncbi:MULTISPECIES: phytanoyl-CoA dioxygenase family protein [unclassified Mesorhizobium]|uniref:phytanoyl-CoA dioxygenase family protein n=1 Tax=unclassified Mesorhizobium TaxID=325217 RepID=UPI000FD5D891|nr:MULTISPECIES: phytanoyl-CoA dioxygenase family protein [unclassified Mesorhizobium]RVB74089.1 phytanoyl-CoA dioxygenase [Mesorhizobium sp. M6A.T.Cr.TU.014.01.1.1]RWQ01717.1 MAG: phytanoyl-CoA dioxygenase [Mesorhizobium sp.]RWQ02328.1 MAG: phytanoyl-CoA dioxygenase [Mesorhizobium sp.]
MPKTEHIGLTSHQVQNFIDDGFVKIENAFSTHLAKQCRDELWADIGLSPDEPENWIHPVVRVGFKASPPFVETANTPILHKAYVQLVGEDRWIAPKALGTFPIRFPSPESPGDDGWHVDMSFGDDNPDFMEWRANVKSSGRALLMLFLFSDVGPDDAPTKIRKGSHATIAKELLPYGDAGATLRQISANGYASTEDCEVELATGAAGTVYLCHPFLVHAAQPHRGERPRFMAQPPLLPRGEFDPVLAPSPVQVAIRQACGLTL